MTPDPPSTRTIKIDLPGEWPNGAKILIDGETAIIHVSGVDSAEDLVAILRTARVHGATNGKLYTGTVIDDSELRRYTDLVRRKQTRFGGRVVQLTSDTFRIDFDEIPSY